MSFSFQMVAVLIIVLTAMLLVLRSLWATWRGRATGCGSSCGKCAAPTVEPRDRFSLPQI